MDGLRSEKLFIAAVREPQFQTLQHISSSTSATIITASGAELRALRRTLIEHEWFDSITILPFLQILCPYKNKQTSWTYLDSSN